MAIIHMDGFDHYTNSASASAQFSAAGYGVGAFSDENVDATPARVFAGVGRALFCQNQNRQVRYDLGSNVTEIFQQCHFMIDDLAPIGSSHHVIFTFYDSAAAHQVTIAVNASGNIVAYRGTVSGTLLGTSDFSLTPDVYTHVACKVVFGNSTAGSIEVRVDGSTVALNLTGIDTVNTANVNCRYVSLGTASGASGGVDMWYDNWYIFNTDWIGERRVETIFPSADTADEDWALSTGSDSYALIDDVSPNDDTDYLSSGTTTDKTIVDLGNLAATTGSVLAVAVYARAKKTDAGSAELKIGLKSDGTEAQSSDIVLETGYKGYFFLRSLDPDGDVSWTPTAVNSLQASIENVT